MRIKAGLKRRWHILYGILCLNIVFQSVADGDSLQWKDNALPESIYKRVTSKVKNGPIVLLHNDAEHTPTALPNIFKTLKEQDYEFVFIEDLIYKENYEIKHDGTQCKIKDGEYGLCSKGQYNTTQKTPVVFLKLWVFLIFSFFVSQVVL